MGHLFYQGVYGTKEYDEEAGVYHGKLQVMALFSYESETEAGLEKAFEQAVEDYVDYCTHY